MTSRAQPSRPPVAPWASLRLLLACLLPVGANSGPAVAPEPVRSARSRPYLTTLGAPQLRFAQAVPPPDLTVHRVAAPPLPPTEEIGQANTAAAATAIGAIEAMPTTTDAGAGTGAPPPELGTVPESADPPPATPAAAKPPPISILPDDTRQKVRAEDFLPFFQFPGSGGGRSELNVIVPVPPTPPAPGTQPPSSATYRQQ